MSWAVAVNRLIKKYESCNCGEESIKPRKHGLDCPVVTEDFCPFCIKVQVGIDFECDHCIWVQYKGHECCKLVPDPDNKGLTFTYKMFFIKRKNRIRQLKTTWMKKAIEMDKEDCR